MTDPRPIELIPVPLEHLDVFWPAAEPFLIKGCERYGVISIADVRKALESENNQLWVAWDTEVKDKPCCGACVTSIEVTDTGEKFGKFMVFGGEEVTSLMLKLDGIEWFFKKNGCTRSRVEGRRGWAKQLPDYKLVSITLEKAL